MANSNFIVHNGLTVGPLTIDAATGTITTSGGMNWPNGNAYSSGTTYSNANVAAYLPTYSGNISAGNVITTSGVFWANGNAYSSGTTAGAMGGGADRAFWENDLTITTNYSITSGKNAGTFGPVTVSSGVTVTIPSGSVWSIV